MVGDGRVGVASGAPCDHTIRHYASKSTRSALLLMLLVGRFEISPPHSISLSLSNTLSSFVCLCASHPTSQEGHPAYHTSTISGGESPVIESVSAGAGTRQSLTRVRACHPGTACETASGARRSVGCLLYEALLACGLLTCCRRPGMLCAGRSFFETGFGYHRLVPRVRVEGGASAQRGRSVRCIVECFRRHVTMAG